MSCQSQEAVPSLGSPKSPEKDELAVHVGEVPSVVYPACLLLFIEFSGEQGSSVWWGSPQSLDLCSEVLAVQNSLSCTYSPRPCLACARKLFWLVKGLLMGSPLSWAAALSFGTSFAQLVALKFPHALGESSHVLAGLQATD